jgi:hypothetical protein
VALIRLQAWVGVYSGWVSLRCAILESVATTLDGAFDGEQFRRVRDEWIELLDARRRAVTERWCAGVDQLRSEYDALVSAGGWTRGPADFFSIVGLSRSEVHHSAMIAWLLDPATRHGLGDRFFQGILQACLPDERGDVVVRSVECEVSRGDTRADIIVWGDHLTLVIENKVDAPEGFRQCDRLYARFGDEVDARFVLLSPSGRIPRTATGEAAEAFSAISYHQLAACLDRAIEQANSFNADGQAVAANYLRTIKEQFG